MIGRERNRIKYMQEIHVSQNEAGQRMDKLLHKVLPEAGNSFLYKMLRKKNITLNGKKAEGKEILKSGDNIRIFLADDTYEKFGGKLRTEHPNIDVRPFLKAYEMLKEIQIIYEDANVLLINKPTGVLSQKASDQDISVNEWFIGYLLASKQITKESLLTYKPSICNRLDRNTSGLLICGKSLKGTQQLNQWIKDRSIKKYYRLFVCGKMTKGAVITGYLHKNEATNKVMISEKEISGSSQIKTIYKPLQVCGNVTYMEVELVTGKTHQIRAHLASIGHPLVGDYKYGNSEYNKIFKRAYQVENQLLHAYRLEFPHISEGEELSELSDQIFYAKEPDVYEQILQTYQA